MMVLALPMQPTHHFSQPSNQAVSGLRRVSLPAATCSSCGGRSATLYREEIEARHIWAGVDARGASARADVLELKLVVGLWPGQRLLTTAWGIDAQWASSPPDANKPDLDRDWTIQEAQAVLEEQTFLPWKVAPLVPEPSASLSQLPTSSHKNVLL
jgi:hypothetical protein